MSIKTELVKLLRKMTGDSTKTAGSVADAISKITTAYTGTPQAANQADSTAADVAGLKADLNGLLAKLKAAGLMAADAT